jgi:molybdopterin-guanine dinucleotide biosynthesis protein A
MSHNTLSAAILAGGRATRFGERDRSALLLRMRVVPVEKRRRFGDPDRLLANVNTPADYADLEAVQGHKL